MFALMSEKTLLGEVGRILIFLVLGWSSSHESFRDLVDVYLQGVVQICRFFGSYFVPKFLSGMFSFFIVFYN